LRQRVIWTKQTVYFGNAKADQVRSNGWLVGQFVPAELGLRHQTDVELKWGIHPDGDKRSEPWANQNGTTISLLVQGSLESDVPYRRRTGGGLRFGQRAITLHSGPRSSTLGKPVGDTIVLSVRFPSVEVGS